jgi:hypothetical protein
MSPLLVRHDSVKTLSDDRLIELEQRDNGLVVFHHREGFSCRDLIRDLDEISRHMTRSGIFSWDANPPEGTPTMDVWMDAVGEHRLPLPAVQLRSHWSGLTLYIGVICRSDMVRPELLREMNGEIAPILAKMLHPIAPRTASGGLGAPLADL